MVADGKCHFRGAALSLDLRLVRPAAARLTCCHPHCRRDGAEAIGFTLNVGNGSRPRRRSKKAVMRHAAAALAVAFLSFIALSDAQSPAPSWSDELPEPASGMTLVASPEAEAPSAGSGPTIIRSGPSTFTLVVVQSSLD